VTKTVVAVVVGMAGSLAIGISSPAVAQLCDLEAYDNMPAERFVTLDGGAVRDRVTGLEWQRCALGHELVNGSCRDDRKKQVRSWFSWADARTEVERLQSDPRFQGWRLPTVQELRTLIYRRCQDPAINQEVFPNPPAWFFWTSTEFADNPDYAWQVDFKTGEINAHLKSSISYNVRLVKGSLLPTSRKREETPADATDERLQAWDDGIHDINDADILLLQHPDQALSGLPRDGHERVDWAKVLLDGTIDPRVTREGGGEMVVWDQDILFTETASMPHVLFPHKLHSMWLACENCHDTIFPAQRGASDISMASIYSGEHCGVCHGKVAFTPNSCERCHSVLHEGSPVKWW